jgi:hypothetical protein
MPHHRHFSDKQQRGSMLPWHNQQEPDDWNVDDDDEEAPPFGLSRYLDVIAMQWYILRQQRDIHRALYRQAVNYRRMSLLWCLMAALWAALFTLQWWHSWH